MWNRPPSRSHADGTIDHVIDEEDDDDDDDDDVNGDDADSVEVLGMAPIMPRI